MQLQTPTRVLEITVISAEDLRSQRRRTVNKNTFVTVRSDPYNHRTTKINPEDEGGYPWWNEKLHVELPSHARSITVEVQYRSILGNNIMVGSANIPVSDFMRDYIPANYLHFLSYRLRDGNGDRNGIVNLSIRVKVPYDYAV